MRNAIIEGIVLSKGPRLTGCHSVNSVELMGKERLGRKQSMSKEQNVQALTKFAEAANTGKFDLFDEAVAPDCVDHDPAPGQGAGPKGYRAFFTEMRTAFPDMKADLVTM